MSLKSFSPLTAPGNREEVIVKLYELIITPRSAFGTPLKGDTIFGQFCWQAVMDGSLLKGGFEIWRDRYNERPFAVFSSAFPVLREENDRRTYYFPVPSCPLHYYVRVSAEGKCFDVLSRLKEIKSKRWMPVSGEILKAVPRAEELLSDRELFRRLTKKFAGDPEERISVSVSQHHNTINRLTLTTGEGEFAPYVMENTWYAPGVEFVIFVLFDEEATDVENIKRGFSSIGKSGFGRDASTGLGRFDLIECRERPLPDLSGTEYLYTLSPFVPSEEETVKIWYKPFVRFGRHGNLLATSRNPFKNPVLMADEGALLKADAIKKPYVGKALSGLSKVLDKTIAQGFSIIIPCVIEKV